MTFLSPSLVCLSHDQQLAKCTVFFFLSELLLSTSCWSLCISNTTSGWREEPRQYSLCFPSSSPHFSSTASGQNWSWWVQSLASALTSSYVLLIYCQHCELHFLLSPSSVAKYHFSKIIQITFIDSTDKVWWTDEGRLYSRTFEW